jgi:anaerobic ribonucleoside-triphosphate reductase activating protein
MEKRIDKIRIAGIINDSIVDGPGIRFVIFCQGCIHNCENCFNAETHSFEGGNEIESKEIIEQIVKNPLISGITFSGGDPMEQADKCSWIANEVKKLGLNVWAYTGYTFEYILDNMNKRKGWYDFIKNIDILVDGKYEEKNRNLLLAFRGSSNQRIIDVQKGLLTGNIIVCDFDL